MGYNARYRKVVVEANNYYIEVFGEKIEALSGKKVDRVKLKKHVWVLMTFIAGMKSYLFLIDEYDQFRQLWRDVAKTLVENIKNSDNGE